MFKFSGTITVVMSVILLTSFAEASDKEEMNYGKLRWGMSPKQVAKAHDYQEIYSQSDSRKERVETYYIKFKNLLVQANYFYANKKKLYLLTFEFGHQTLPLKGSNVVKRYTRMKPESKEKMLHFFNLLKDMYEPKFGEGKTVDKSSGNKLDMMHTWESKTALWRIWLETDKDGYHRLQLSAWNKKLNKEMKGK